MENGGRRKQEVWKERKRKKRRRPSALRHEDTGSRRGDIIYALIFHMYNMYKFVKYGFEPEFRPATSRSTPQKGPVPQMFNLESGSHN